MSVTKRTALIMAGGRGERFWPKSRRNRPKQFLSITDSEKTMIQLTVDRISPMIAAEDIFVVTGREYEGLINEQLPQIPAENIIYEPFGLNTAPCICLGAAHIAAKYGEASMCVLPSDHLIKYNEIFRSVLSDAFDIAEAGNNLVTIGITPSYPETGYGYIKYIPEYTVKKGFKVEQFVEKPDYQTAKQYISSDRYLWNSGMFVWSLSTILENYQLLMPDVYETVMEIGRHIGSDDYEEALESGYAKIKPESIDYGIMERGDDIFCVSGSFGWDDVGSWLALGRVRTPDEFGNVITGKTVSVDSERCIIQGDKRLIACVGVEDLIIVDTDDALLVCRKSEVGSIRKVVESLRLCDEESYI